MTLHRSGRCRFPWVVVQFGKEASQTRDYCVARQRRFARLAQILRCAKNACSRMTLKLHHHLTASARAQLADYIVDERLGIPKEHQGPIKIVERIVNYREAGTHAAVYHHSSSRFVYIENRHSVNRAGGIGAGCG